jgi:catechol 2,3-dioxygenase-like lactoylglutathione lyase family enzyme
MIEGIIPILRVSALPASLDYYVRVLGFRIDWQERFMASVSRDGQAIMLCQGAQGNPGTWMWIGVRDVDALLAELEPRGATIRMRPRNFPWAYETHVADPDGHVLRFGCDTKDDQPLEEFPS